MMPLGPGPMTLQPPELAPTFAGAKKTASKGKGKAKKPASKAVLAGKRPAIVIRMGTPKGKK